MTITDRTEQQDNDSTSTLSNKNYKKHKLDIEKAATLATGVSDIYLPYIRKSEGEYDPNPLEKTHSQIDEASIVEPPPKDILDDAPDGGYGWAVAVAGFFGNFVMFGIASIWGVFSQAYATSILEGKASTLSLMTVGSVAYVCLNVFTPISVLFVRFGTRFNYGFGSILMCLGMILSGFSTEVWHLYLTQGLLFGFGASFLYMSIASVIPQWFTTRRGTAMGISSAGTGLGGLTLSPMASFLISEYGIPWAYRILGLFSLGICCVGTILVKDRLPRSYRKNLLLKSPVQWSMFKMADFDIWLVGAVIALMGYLSPMFYLPKYAAEIGINETDSSNLLGILCAMNGVGRLVLGYIADKIGRLNMFLIASAFAGVCTFIIWPFATSYDILLVYSILWGFSCGTYYALAAPVTGSVVGMEKLSSGLSILFIVSAISAMGTPIAAAIQDATPELGYLGIQMFIGSVYVGGALICLYLKYRVTGSLLSVY
ncbi:major facilitator superfamily domain-containing protein [Zychaea mexicana]|uniref:major facilitator superfamily domain-containing protein n=1 Tax=Zychaea mexicana TaxID=64656 RepID=UPI0022FE86D4|nr:major facilitator superfamily domain-containing protein [Zychaea mexicana]KAI9495835.1 major facilitator superfamily domain-containing protein [Zychaea mexicana]